MDVFFTLDLIGTAVFAYTGSIAAKKQRFHALGVLYISFLTAVGGGTVRSVLLQTPDLFWMKSSAYLIVVSIVVAASYLPLMRFNTNRLWFYILDSQSLAIFVALGTHVTLQQGQPLHIAFAMGILSGIGGGLIRDAITSQAPQALTDPAYPIMMISAAIGSVVSMNMDLPIWLLSCIAVLCVVLISATYNYLRTGKTTAQKYNSGSHSPEQRKVSVESKSILLSGTQALGVIGLMCVTGFYFISAPSPATTNVAVMPVANGTNVDLAQEKYDYQLLLDAANAHLDRRQIDKAEQLIARLSLKNRSDDRFEQLKIRTLKLQSYLALLDKAEIALAANDIPELQKTVSRATEFGIADQRLQSLSIGLLNAREREDIDSANRDLAAKSYQLHLANAAHYLAAGSVDLASAEVDAARLYGFEDDALHQVEIQIVAEKRFAKTPLSKTEFEYASNQFNHLVQAIKLRNIKAVSTLTAGNVEKQQLFADLFDRYLEINAVVTRLSTTNDSKMVSATLVLENMRLPNGNLTYPPDSYGLISLSMQYTRQGWSKIQW